MTKDERLAFIKQWAQPYAHNMSGLTGDINFLLAELDAAKVTAFTTCPNCGAGLEDGQCRECIESDAWLREQNAMLKARVQRLTDALERTPCDIFAHSDCRAQSPAIIKKMGMCPRCAALAEGEDSRG